MPDLRSRELRALISVETLRGSDSVRRSLINIVETSIKYPIESSSPIFDVWLTAGLNSVVEVSRVDKI